MENKENSIWNYISKDVFVEEACEDLEKDYAILQKIVDSLSVNESKRIYEMINSKNNSFISVLMGLLKDKDKNIKESNINFGLKIFKISFINEKDNFNGSRHVIAIDEGSAIESFYKLISEYNLDKHVEIKKIIKYEIKEGVM